MKNIISMKLDHSTRNDSIYYALKDSPAGLTRQELFIFFDGAYNMDQISSATGSLIQSGKIFVMDHRINPKTGQLNEVLGLNFNPYITPKVSRKQEVQNLKDRIVFLENQNRKAIDVLKKYFAKFGAIKI